MMGALVELPLISTASVETGTEEGVPFCRYQFESVAHALLVVPPQTFTAVNNPELNIQLMLFPESTE
jgi:hypothetical protein